MATYTVYIAFTAGKGSSVSFRYPTTTSTTGTGHTSSNPLVVGAGDNVKFVEVSGSAGGGTISGLDIFTDNSNFSYSGTDGTGEIADRTVDSGGVVTDTITGTTGVGGNTDTFFIRRQESAPVMKIAKHFNNQAASVTVQVDLTSNGVGGTLKYAAGDSVSTPPSSGWQTSNQFTQARETTKYYWASIDEDTAGKFSSSSKVEVAANPALTAMPPASVAKYGIQIFNDQNRLAFSSRRRALVLQYTNTYTLAAGASTTISDVANANDKDQVAIFIEGISNYSHTGTGNAVKISGRTSNSVTITNSGSESKSFRVKIMRVT